MRFSILSGLLLLFSLQPVAAQGQAEAALACLRQTHSAGKACEHSPTLSVVMILEDPDGYSRPVVTTLLDGLEDLALDSDENVRGVAVASLMTPGRKVAGSPTIRGIVDRLSRVYHQSRDYGVRTLIVSQMHLQIEEAEAAAFLEAVAQEDNSLDSGSDRPPAHTALVSLTRMGPRGQAVLERLHAQGTVPGIAKGYLEYLKQRDFQPD